LGAVETHLPDAYAAVDTLTQDEVVERLREYNKNIARRFTAKDKVLFA
jgi:hypothetical protein